MCDFEDNRRDVRVRVLATGGVDDDAVRQRGDRAAHRAARMHDEGEQEPEKKAPSRAAAVRTKGRLDIG